MRAAPMQDVRFLRRKPRVTDLREDRQGNLTDQSGQADVKIEWHMNKQAERDKVFRLTIDGKEAYISLEELLFYTRMV